MGAKVIPTGLKAGDWAESKPSDYKGNDLDTALKAYEAEAAKGWTIPADPPTAKAGEIKTYIAELNKTLASLATLTAAAGKVSAAAAKTAADLKKLAKDAKDPNAYNSAAGVASSIGANAAKVAKDLA